MTSRFLMIAKNSIDKSAKLVAVIRQDGTIFPLDGPTLRKRAENVKQLPAATRGAEAASTNTALTELSRAQKECLGKKSPDDFPFWGHAYPEAYEATPKRPASIGRSAPLRRLTFG